MTGKYRVNEIFYSLQGEGRWAGRAAVFVRLSGCNLRCPFCDTDFSDYREMGAEEIVKEAKRLGGDCRFIVITGGEPTLQVDEPLTALLHQEGFFISMETNGTRPIPKGIDWVTCSPKSSFVDNGNVAITEAQEVKVVFDGIHAPNAFGIQAQYYYVQPCDVEDEARNQEIIRNTVAFVESHPTWQLSLQIHKILNVR